MRTTPVAPRGYLHADTEDGVAVLRGHYAGYTNVHETFGIVSNSDVYKDEDAETDNEGDETSTRLATPKTLQMATRRASSTRWCE